MISYKRILKTLLVGILMFLTLNSLQAQDANIESWIEKAREAGIEQSVLAEFRNRIQDYKGNSEEFGSIMKSAIAMTEENLPAEVVIHKALEGFSKGVPTGRIVSVVDQVHQSVREAAKIVDPWMNKPEVKEMMQRPAQAMDRNKFRNELAKATSKSIMQNIPVDAVNEVLSQIGTKSVLSNASPAEIVAAMGILPDIPSTADQPQASGKFIGRALKGGFKAEELQKLPSAIKVAQQRSELPASSVIEGVTSQMRGGIPARQILKNLFNGKVGGGPPGNVPKGLKENPGRGKGNSNGV